MNKTQPKNNSTGKFEKKVIQEPAVEQTPLSDADAFIHKVKNELYAGNIDLERIRQAYSIITGADADVNIKAMKLAILNHQ